MQAARPNRWAISWEEEEDKHTAQEQGEPERDHLLDRAKSWPAQAQGSMAVASEQERRARSAQVHLSWGSMQWLPPEEGADAGNEPLPLWVVRVGEPLPPSKEPAQREDGPSEKHGANRHRDPQREEGEAWEWIRLSA